MKYIMKVFNSLFNKTINTKTKIPFPIIDIYLFRWNKLKHTGIHDHADKGCFLFLLKGEIEENIYSKDLKFICKNLHIAPTKSYINNNIGFHSIKPLKNSISLHFYYPKNHKTKYITN